MVGSGSRRALGSSTVSAGRTGAAPARPQLAAPVLRARAITEDEFSGFASMNFIDLDLSFLYLLYVTLSNHVHLRPRIHIDLAIYRNKIASSSMPTSNEQLVRFWFRQEADVFGSDHWKGWGRRQPRTTAGQSEEHHHRPPCWRRNGDGKVREGEREAIWQVGPSCQDGRKNWAETVLALILLCRDYYILLGRDRDYHYVAAKIL
jgi:hypothetical protein